MSNTPLAQLKSQTQQGTKKHVKILEIEDGFISLRCLSPKKLRFEIEYSLGHGTTSNAFLFFKNHISTTVLINPPGANFEEVFLPALNKIIGFNIQELLIVIGHINPNRIKLSGNHRYFISIKDKEINKVTRTQLYKRLKISF